MTCPECGQPLPGELDWKIKQVEAGEHAATLGKVGWFSVTVSSGKHSGWALQPTEAEARDKALLRLRYYEEIYA